MVQLNLTSNNACFPLCKYKDIKLKLNLITFYAVERAKYMVLIEYGNVPLCSMPSAVNLSPGGT